MRATHEKRVIADSYKKISRQHHFLQTRNVIVVYQKKIVPESAVFMRSSLETVYKFDFPFAGFCKKCKEGILVKFWAHLEINNSSDQEAKHAKNKTL